MSSAIWTSLSAGLLPKWLLLVAIVSTGNSIQAYTSLGPTQRVYSRSPSVVTPLSARTFGTWTFLSAVVRLYAAFNIHDPAVYQLAFATFAVAWLHFICEWFVYRSTTWGAGLAGPVLVSTTSLAWMWASWGYYLG